MTVALGDHEEWAAEEEEIKWAIKRDEYEP